jgi:hypothetical protein
VNVPPEPHVGVNDALPMSVAPVGGGDPTNSSTWLSVPQTSLTVSVYVPVAVYVFDTESTGSRVPPVSDWYEIRFTVHGTDVTLNVAVAVAPLAVNGCVRTAHGPAACVARAPTPAARTAATQTAANRNARLKISPPSFA